MQKILKRLTRVVALSLAFALMPAYAEIGAVERAQGDVTLQTAKGKPLAVTQGQSVEEAQVVRTGADGEVVLRFTDNSLLVLRPNTEVQLTRYNYKQDDTSSMSVLSLFKGGLRYVTGLIGKQNHDNVKIGTPVSTIGIRGTDFDTVYRDTREDDIDAGTYTCVSDGGAYMTDEKGNVVEIAKGETAFLTSADLVAKGLAHAASAGLIHPPAGLFRAGTFDGELQNLKEEGLRRLNDKISEKVPGAVRDVLPDDIAGTLGGLFGGHKKKAQAATGCAS